MFAGLCAGESNNSLGDCIRDSDSNGPEINTLFLWNLVLSLPRLVLGFKLHGGRSTTTTQCYSIRGEKYPEWNIEVMYHFQATTDEVRVNVNHTNPMIHVMVGLLAEDFTTVKASIFFQFWVSERFLWCENFAEVVPLKQLPTGVTGLKLVYVAPVILLAILAAVYLMISGEDDHQIQGKLIGIMLVVAYIVWACYAYAAQICEKYSLSHQLSILEWSKIFEVSGLKIGSIGLFCLAFLFHPYSRGSVLLRFIDIPYRTCYQIPRLALDISQWLSFTLHGIAYVAAWAMQGHLIKELLEWKDIGVANLAWVISLIAGLLMWFTSFGLVRKQYFELFFYTHQLYIIFIVFLVLHPPPIHVGTMELVVSKPAVINIPIFPLSVLFSSLLAVRDFLEDGPEKLRGHISSISEDEPVKQQAPSTLTVSVEGPYGHETPYHLMYENLILVAGGIGVSPFLAILSDILHRAKEGNPCLPKNVVLVWAIKTSDELPLLSAVDIESVCPEEGRVHTPSSTCIFPVSRGHAISGLVGTGDNVWSGLYIISSIVGFIVLLGLLDVYYINPFHVTTWWYKGLLFIACMTASIIVFGGLVVVLWNNWDKRVSTNEQRDYSKRGGGSKHHEAHKDSCLENIANSNTIQYGSRPDFHEIFESVSERWGAVDVGVIVCGPAALQSSVAKECRSQNMNRSCKHPIFTLTATASTCSLISRGRPTSIGYESTTSRVIAAGF
ncbi:unnamed protein product [Rhodiola kirilowii]